MSCLVTSETNILNDLRNLQVSPWGNILRKKQQIMKKMICQESSTFKPIWEEKSPKAIFYESDRIYTNDYRKCYYSFGCSGTPDLLYKLPSCPKNEKIEDALVCEFNTSNISVPVATFIVFEVFPLRLHSHIALTKQVFKKSISDASIFQGLLILMHSGNLVRLFSYDRLVEEYTNVAVSLDNFSADGIPITVGLKDLPPVLFEVKCNEHNLWLGGVPLHYLYQPNHQDVYKVCQLKTNQVVEKGSIPVSLDAYETDNLFFLSDDSNRLVHVTVHYAQILKINIMDNGASRIDELFSVFPHEAEENATEDNWSNEMEGVRTWVMSSFGRIIKRRVSQDVVGAVSSRIFSLQYDNDLNLMVATSLVAEQHKTGTIDAFVCFHDDDTGRKLKTVELEEDWDDTYDHTITLDLDTLIHTYKDYSGYCCVLYRLDRSIPEDNTEKRPKR
ncbi:putative DDB1- and CUL4-associated factor 17 [Apostichopus japonicus]|uniref:Putative DDB1-and CUL4-associated factor 17 n=1 Tax=Stichopus japonicus TaxID=307972 RepID=A0A2G8KK40_STIJA|nr:putative DDB1- and CUL4-associated factor 17 [Apostichopus japonicus]